MWCSGEDVWGVWRRVLGGLGMMTTGKGVIWHALRLWVFSTVAEVLKACAYTPALQMHFYRTGTQILLSECAASVTASTSQKQITVNTKIASIQINIFFFKLKNLLLGNTYSELSNPYNLKPVI